MKSLLLLLFIISTSHAASVDCDGVCGVELKINLSSSLLQDLDNITRFSTDKSFPDTLPGDPRKVRSNTSPKWLAAVGRMVTHISSTKQKQCSLSIISDSPKKDGIIAVTAAHCVDHWITGTGDFKPGYNEITFTSNNGKTVKRKIVAVFKAELNPGDYAIVKLDSYIPKEVIKPLINTPIHYSDLINDVFFHTKFKSFATMAGFSADKRLGKKGKVMTYHEKCQLNGGGSGQKLGYCYSYQGASGGPIVVTVDLGEDADYYGLPGTQHFFVGSVVGARPGDNNSKTVFTDTSSYSIAIDKILKNH